MSNVFSALPVPVGNGVGAAVDVSTFGGTKTIVVTGTAQCAVDIEINLDAAQAGSWQSIGTIQNRGSITTVIACRFMRVRVSGYNVNVGGTSQVDVGSTDLGTLFASLPVPAGNGVGAAVDVSTLVGLVKTVQIGGAFQGVVLVEVSVDGTTDWAQLFSFSNPGQKTMELVAGFMRVRRSGVPVINPGAPVANVGATSVGDGGGGSTVSLTVFTYEVTGAEDLSDFTVTLPDQIDVPYGVVANCQGCAMIVAVDITNKTPTTFDVVGTGDFTAGDVIVFFVSPIT